MRVHDYSCAVRTLIDEGKPIDVVLTNLKRTLMRTGKIALFSSILRSLLKEYTHRTHTAVPEVFFARETDRVRHAKEVEDLLVQNHGVSSYVPSFDDTLIGGFIIRHNDTIIDRSLKRQLVTLYRSLKG